MTESLRRDPTTLARPEILQLVPYSSARDKATRGLLLDANVNPYSCGMALNRYPDPDQRKLRQALGQYLQHSPDQVLAATGSDEVLEWIFKVFCRPGRDCVAIASPTYGMYRVLAEIYGVGVQEFPLGTRQFEFSGRDFLAWVAREVKVLFLCSPNNPTGNLLSQREICRVAEGWQGIVVVDEAYVEFSRSKSLASVTSRLENVIVVRTFSKALARAGLRLGYAVASPPVIELFRKVKSPYNLGRPAQLEGCRALATRDWETSIERIRRERRYLYRQLSRLPGVDQVFPSEANFLLFRCRQATRVQATLAAQGVVIRDRGQLPGLENCLRVTVGRPEQNRRFLETLEAVLLEVE